MQIIYLRVQFYDVWLHKKTRVEETHSWESTSVWLQSLYACSQNKWKMLDLKSFKYIFMGYKDGVKGYKLYIPSRKYHIISYDVILRENVVGGKKKECIYLNDDDQEPIIDHVHHSIIEQENQQASSQEQKNSSVVQQSSIGYKDSQNQPSIGRPSN